MQTGGKNTNGNSLAGTNELLPSLRRQTFTLGMVILVGGYSIENECTEGLRDGEARNLGKDILFNFCLKDGS